MKSTLVRSSLPEQRIADRKRSEALVYNPRKGMDVRAEQILLKLGRLMNRSGFGQSDKQNLGELGIAQARQESPDRFRSLPGRP